MGRHIAGQPYRYRHGWVKLYPEIKAGDLSSGDARRSRAVSSTEFQSIAKRGEVKMRVLSQASSKPSGLDDNFDAIADHAYAEAQKDWGGVTVDTHTGHEVRPDADAYAITTRNPGTSAIAISEKASKAEFHDALKKARIQHAQELSRKGAHLGVFHDNDKGTIDIDPVTVVNSLKDVEEIGAYTHAVGGAYHFKSGNGYWPPHVKD